MIVKEITTFGRHSISLENNQVRTVIDALGGMMPEFSLKRGGAAINAHWIPDFRDKSGAPYEPAKHGDYWKANLLTSSLAIFRAVRISVGHAMSMALTCPLTAG